ncbi:sodium:proton antiporter [Sansalvadorimonas sp. 2012CJ34-2]|uniref:Sodium:proton antiporter n=1 Tax=Parendozoicomonas callyspongiae TaxID=2942213 RepID=A0ABT0PE83_9GAMM|nr:sodium:proton antiporter [Sansalvadorimonas sp. 2012CJ34-2]MCL6269675.1 sodium:proton antiporter [Sansalvadorimonas sp. 2012CJ34-2]
MPNELVLEPLFLFFGLLFTATISASLFRLLRVPYTVGLLVVGIALSALTEWFPTLAALNTVTLSSDLILYVILPTLIFEAAINIDAKMLLKNLAPIMLLAVLGVLISAIIIAASLYSLDILPLGAALIFGALISATDPVAVIALFKELKANKRLTLLMDGESLFNDATAIVLFTVLVGMVGSGATLASADLWGALGQFVFTFFGGVLFGGFMGLAMVLLLKFSRQDRFAQRTQMIIMAYMTFIIADHFLHLSGVMAVLVAGIIVSLNRHRIMDERRWENINIFWEYATFVANSFIFLMMGMTENKLFENLNHLFHILPILTVTAFVVIAARAVIIYGLVPVSNKLGMAEHINKGMQTVMFWGGLRGAVPIALMLALPEGMPGRELIFEMVLAMILVTLLMQGTTTGQLLHHFRLAGDEEEAPKQVSAQSV